MAAIFSDDMGIFAWGWNHSGSGYGTHAEEHAISRANRKRLKGCVASVAGLRHRPTGTVYVFSSPCRERCWPLLERVGVKTIEFLNLNGTWTVRKL
jgi:pyrimidine deaminase RibD-like protein